MSNNDSPKPSEATAAPLRSRAQRWYRHILEGLLLVLAFVLLSQWLSRHLLDDGSQLPDMTLAQLNIPSDMTLSWPAQHPKTLIYFFAPWCSVCRISMPGLNTLDNSEQLRIVAIALDYQTVSEVEAFIADTGFRHPVLLGNDALRDTFKISGYPSYYVVNRQGQVIHKDRGLSTPPGLWLRTRL